MSILREKDGCYSIILESPYVPTVKIRGARDIKGINSQVRASLEARGFGAAGLHRNPQGGTDALEYIRKIGSSALGDLVTYGGPAASNRNREVVKKFLSNVREKAPPRRAPVLFFSSPVDFPVELLPVFDRSQGRKDLPSPDGPGLEARAKGSFLGMHFAVRKYIQQSGEAYIPGGQGQLIGSSDSAKEQDVALAPYWNQTLLRVAEEIRGLRGLDFLIVGDPLPSQEMASRRNADEELARLLVTGRDVREGVVHITAHCHTASKSSYDHSITFAARKSRWKSIKEVDVRLYTIKAVHGELDSPIGESPCNRLAFISACGAANVRYDSPSTIPDAFLDCGYAAVVAPLVSIHVDSAAAFALHFYRSLDSDSNSTVGGALVEARKHLLRQFSNPVGLAYTCYGESRLRLPRKG
ncbi:CHAT domain-containing protein [Streptomyces collinus]|uniref:CHAT domain-containing protein n=1 Tax=Streptomyces collinus TaxID=42684 RepID=UPI003448F14F